MLRITFARHGNCNGTGPYADLNDIGRNQAQALASAIVAQKLHVNGTNVLTSEYMRALSTAAVIRDSIKSAGCDGVSLHEYPFLNLNINVSIIADGIEKSDAAVGHSVGQIARLSGSGIIAVSHAENIILLTAAFTKQGGKAFLLDKGECVTYDVDATSWSEAVSKGLETCSKVVWKHGNPRGMMVT